jgi:hypothetical protein
MFVFNRPGERRRRPLPHLAAVPLAGLLVATALTVPEPAVAAEPVRPGTLITLEASNPDLPGWKMRHRDGVARMDVITPASDEMSRKDATWWVRPGLAAGKCPARDYRAETLAVSFESYNHPGEYLRHAAFRVRKEPSDGSATFAADATFCVHRGWTGAGLAFESYNVDRWWLRHWWGELYIAMPYPPTHPWDAPERFFDDATWRVVNPLWSHRAATPLARNTGTSAIQLTPAQAGQLGTIEYAYVDNVGRLLHGRQRDPDNSSSLQWTTISGGEAFTGQPAVAQLTDGRVQVSTQNTNGSTWSRTQKAVDNPDWNDWSQLGGFLASPPVTAKMPDGSIVSFAIGQGELWAHAQSTLLPHWRSLGRGPGGSGLIGTPAVVPTRNGIQVFALDADGTLATAEYRDVDALSGWTSLGGSGLTGLPLTIVYPGYRMRVFVRAAGGTVLTKAQDFDEVWSTDWQSTGPFVAAGSPAAILDPVEGRTAVVARGTDNQIYRMWETAAGSGEWGGWAKAIEAPDPAATDPTVVPVTNTSGQTWYIVFRNANSAIRIYERSVTVPAGTLATSAAERSAADVRGKVRSTPEFTAVTLPRPPATP